MRVIHHTSLYCLEKILSSGKFIAVSNSPLNADSGMNCFAIGKSGNMAQRFENLGAILVCEWYGQVNTVGMNLSPPYKPNILYDMLPWRCFVPVGSERNNLRVVSFRVSEQEFLETIRNSKYSWLPKSIKGKIFRRQKLALLLKLRSYVKNGKCFLDVV